MTITIKGQSVYITQTSATYPVQCQWCGKEIKTGKIKFYSSLSGNDVSCSMSHVKQMVKNKI